MRNNEMAPATPFWFDFSVLSIPLHLPNKFPSNTTTDDVYQGYHIPKGATEYILVYNSYNRSNHDLQRMYLLPDGELSPTAKDGRVSFLSSESEDISFGNVIYS
ncbi:hypothetical protein BDR05DRAFT_683237 [Suillus weaverae]|nr:hypothetical protein BDR05DRAFT_683237 [Suillus weaverae]